MNANPDSPLVPKELGAALLAGTAAGRWPERPEFALLRVLILLERDRRPMGRPRARRRLGRGGLPLLPRQGDVVRMDRRCDLNSERENHCV